MPLCEWMVKSTYLGLWNKEIRVNERAGAQRAPNEEHVGLEISLRGADHVWGDDGNDRVPQPIGCSGESDTTRANGEREDLADDNPGARSPGAGDEEDEDGNEG